ncbi:uncharacterized protein LOC121238307 isoform X2 [Juglans microcarpa x Juglans regia]|uniref:uncharacterized protein LOC121238307 isoform X2 n=1 Tax=Juglans microcarpa x Juglans regia TaxID=2249226 RepID=UPI001B7F0306|nr:uncharacterized protein LOC121238307 isoform X2 [Juglans microcarpa x Juglans regia]
MDHMTPRERDFEGDIESGLTISEDESIKVPFLGATKQETTLLEKICGGFIDGPIKNKESSCGDFSNSNRFSPETVRMVSNKILERVEAVDYVKITPVKDKRKKSSNKKPPKPPRPPRGPSLDAADQKLIKEISELAMLKKARIERMKALKKMKVAKSSSPNSSSIFAMVLTILFCLVIIFQGMSSSRNSPVNFQGSPVSAGPTDSGLISVHYYAFPSAI